MSESKSTQRQRQLRVEIVKKLGGRCRVCGFDDVRALHIDHVEGKGSSELRRGYGGGLAYYYRVRKDTTGRYQILCANCNAIKRYKNGEARGAHQHKQPARLRPALQGDAATIRRVKPRCP